MTSNYISLRTRFYQQFGIDTGRSGLGDTQIHRQMQEIATSQNLTLEQLLDRALKSRAGLLEVASIASVTETYFMRHESQLNVLADYFATVSADAAPRTIWCAGCSSGEEAYSVAIALHQKMSDPFASQISIRASDVNKSAVEKAKQGIYGEWSFRNVPPWIRQRYFSRSDENDMVLNASLKRMVRFWHESIQDRLAMTDNQQFDAILFRNVSIYFTDEAMSQVLAAMVRVLKPGGWLLVAPSDPPPRHDLLRYHPNGISGIYQRVDPSTSKASQRNRSHLSPPQSVAPVFFKDESAKNTADEFNVTVSAPAQIAALTNDLDSTITDFISKGDAPGAIAFLNDQISCVSSQSGRALFLRGKLNFEQGNFVLAKTDFQKSGFLSPADELIQMWMILCLFETGEQKRGRSQAESLLRRLKVSNPTKVLTDGKTTVREVVDSLSAILEVN